MKTSVKTLGVIMDGNRRWATEKGLPKQAGHKEGVERLISCIEWCKDFNIDHVVFYAFSTENWSRSTQEVKALMDLFEYVLVELREKILEQDIRIRFVGDFKKVPKQLMKLAHVLEEETKSKEKTAWICLSYGGRAELAHAAGQVAGRVTEKKLEQALWTAQMPDLDMIIRTGGNHRLSNFLLWRAAYAELYFTKTKWPAFTKTHFKKSLEWYEKNIEINKGG